MKEKNKTMDEKNPDVKEPVAQGGFKNWLKQLYSILLLIVVLLLVGSVGYLGIRLYKAEQAYSKQQVLIQERVVEVLMEKSKESLQVTMKPLVWAIRAELLRDNLEQVELYVNDLVKLKHFNLILVVDAEGRIVTASDKKLELSQFTDHYDARYLKGSSTQIEFVDSSKYHITAPIMGLDSRIGTLFIEYFPEDELNYRLPELGEAIE